jgi:tetratricopeptide (TPR) repeat protein
MLPALLSLLLVPALPAARPALPAPPAARATQDEGDDIAARYRAAAEADDSEALAELWRANPGRILVTIDADLEGSLRLRESAPDAPDEEAIAKLHRRALVGARVATEATGHPIFLDYASSFVGWDAGQQKQFREGQAAFGKAREALGAGDPDEAERQARRCIELAEPLGDWWGTAMGEAVLGRVLAQQGRLEEALVALSRARLVHHDLGLQGSEYGNMLGMVDVLARLGRHGRGLVVAKQALALARALGDDENVPQLEQAVTDLEQRLASDDGGN